jgi:predicted site-specific integrase-resolvase
MPKNKLKEKVEGLTKIVKQLVTEIQHNANMSQGVLTALQIHVGENEWNKIVEELKDREVRASKEQEKKLEL